MARRAFQLAVLFVACLASIGSIFVDSSTGALSPAHLRPCHWVAVLLRCHSLRTWRAEDENINADAGLVCLLALTPITLSSTGSHPPALFALHARRVLPFYLGQTLHGMRTSDLVGFYYAVFLPGGPNVLGGLRIP
jgi:hypothetical protein